MYKLSVNIDKELFKLIYTLQGNNFCIFANESGGPAEEIIHLRNLIQDLIFDTDKLFFQILLSPISQLVSIFYSYCEWEDTGIVSSYKEVRFYKNFIVLEKSENKLLIYFKFQRNKFYRLYLDLALDLAVTIFAANYYYSQYIVK